MKNATLIPQYYEAPAMVEVPIRTAGTLLTGSHVYDPEAASPLTFTVSNSAEAPGNAVNTIDNASGWGEDF